MNRDRIINKFIEYAKIYSPSLKEKDFADVLINDLTALGAKITIDNADKKCNGTTGNIIAYIKGTLEGEPILLSSHIDTVVPCENINPIVLEDRIVSDKTTILSSDDKAGITAIIEGIRYVKENNIPHRDIEIAFTIAEEIGLLGSKHLDYSLFNSKIAYVLDSDGAPGSITVQSPAHVDIKATFTGVAKHAGLEPENGISAIQMAADAISNMKLLRVDPETSANVGTIKGGKADNIVAETCVVTFEARSLCNEKVKIQLQHMLDVINNAAKKFGGKVDIEHELAYEAISLSEENPAIELFKKACDKCNFKYVAESSGGGSDASNLSGNGINAACIGVGMQNVHSTEEFILIKDLVNSAKLVTALITTL